MAKIGTAHIELKPVLDEGALETLTSHIEDAVADAVAQGFKRGMASSNETRYVFDQATREYVQGVVAEIRQQVHEGRRARGESPA